MATIKVPQVVPSPADDSRTLHRAFQGLGTDEKAIIRTLGRRNTAQRGLIRDTFRQLYNKSLIDCLHAELSGDFRKAVILWTYDPAERDARLANQALTSRQKGITELQVIVEIACAAPPHHLAAVRRAYCTLFDVSLEEDITAKAPLPVQKVLVRLVSSFRFDKEAVDSSIAAMEAVKLRKAIEAVKLRKAIEAKKLDDDDELIRVLTTRNAFQLRETFKLYKINYGRSIDEDIMSCGKGILESLLKVVIWCIDSPEKHFAEVVRAAIVGLGTDEDSLTRAIVSRAEIDMVRIGQEYLEANKTSLEEAVIGDTSWDYKDFLITLLGADI
ncbi:annexin D3-like isoform X2 [Andrographis paniculata]|uniref:annexin D3-like isoform X2 n=1 Tax=Andrographis paniculata TaxID=175694 RepID=UPI0021E9AABA|nr:annexin D3-like isoform X2 [Andrographis paniculata]